MIRNFFKALFYPLFGNIRSKKAAAPASSTAPLASDHLFIFAGTFATELDASDYAIGIGGGASLSDDLGGLAIGPDDVEIVFGQARITATGPMLHFRGPRADMGDANTLLLLSDRSYDPKALTGDRVTYLGQCSVT